MPKRKILVTVLIFLFVFLPAVLAQDATSISYGDTISGRIANSKNPDFYLFDGDKGDTVNISATSDDTDVYIQLGDKDGNLLVENDDISGSDVNAALEYQLPVSGTYLILVGAYDTGSYELSLGSDSVPSQGSSNVSDNTLPSLGYGDTASGSAISIDKPVVYTFNGKAGDSVSISLSSDQVDTYLVLTDQDGNLLAENDDISDSNVNSHLETVLPANGDYLIGVFAYDAGPFDLTLDSGSGNGGAPTTSVSDDNSNAQTASGSINSDNYYIEYPLTNVKDGDTISIDATATSGDLDLYLGLFKGDTVVAENDDRDQNTTDASIQLPSAEAGDYSVVVTRYGYQDGETEGDFDLSVKVSSGGGGFVNSSPNSPSTVNPVAAGYPTAAPSPIADWTVLVYMGGDNNLEDGLENDLNEFEIAGGSTSSVRIVALLDRASDYDTSNGNWTDTRVFEVGKDRSKDDLRKYPPTIDTSDLFDLGELDTSYGNNLADFLTWGIQNYPAQHYAVAINDHGGAWEGMVTDDTTGNGILTLPEFQQAFASALHTTGVPKFDLLINDACLMSNVEYFTTVAPYFDYSLSSPEITLNPSFDMTLLTETLNKNPNIDIGQLGKMMADKYMKDMTDLSPDTAPVLGVAVTDLRKIGTLNTALDKFDSIVNDNPAAYGSVLGQVRANTYAYSFFLPEDEYGPATNIDLGSFMAGVIQESKDKTLVNAAQGVLDALDSIRIYGTAGKQLAKSTSFYNIYFPARSSDFIAAYSQISPLTSWNDMLRSYYGSVGVNPRAFRGIAGSGAANAPAAPSLIPQVNITNVFPTETSVAVPTKVSMEVIGRNIAQGTFTVDQVQPDGSLIRLDSSRIVTTVVVDGVADEINQWNPGIDDSTFTWEVQLSEVTDGSTNNEELVSFTDGVASLAGIYTYPNSDQTVEVTVLFDDNGNTSSVVSRAPGTTALATVKPDAGGKFQTYQSVVTPDGRVVTQPGTTYIWPENGISWHETPAPDGKYNLGFLVEAFGGATGFDSTTVTVDNSGVDNSLKGYVDMDWGFIYQRPSDWTNVVYFPDGYLSTNNPAGDQSVFVYSVTDETDLKQIIKKALEPYNAVIDDITTPTTVDGQDALEFTQSYTTDSGKKFTGKGFAVYLEDLKLGLVFSSEGADPAETKRIYKLVRDKLTFFDAQSVKAQDQGLWETDNYTSADFYPVRKTWLPGADDNGWWKYRPDDDPTSTTFAGVTVLTDPSDDAASILQNILDTEISKQPNYQFGSSETYYGENNTWEMASFTHDGPNGEEITGRVYVTTKDTKPYLLWFEAPTDQFSQLLKDAFFVMLDGFKITPADSSTS
ncbi:MAG: clostripain-related cysteine peptidase [Chloroflexota bacterium]